MDFDPLDLYGSDSSDIWQHRMLQYECTKFKRTDTNWLVINGYIFFGVLLLASIATWLTSKKEKQECIDRECVMSCVVSHLNLH